MKLSEALTLKAEWWLAPIDDNDNELEEELCILLNDEDSKSYDPALPNMFYKTSECIRINYPVPAKGQALNKYGIAWLCLLEAEFQKDEEYPWRHGNRSRIL